MKKLLKYLKPYWYIAIFSPICMIMEVLVDLSLPKIMSTIVNDSLYAATLEEGLAVVAKSGVLMMALVILGGLTGLGAAGFASAASQSFGNDLRRDAFSHVMSLSPEQTDRFTVGSLVTRLTNDITMMQSFVAMALRIFFRSPIMFIGGIIMAISMGPKFGIVILISLPIQLLIVYLVMNRVRPMFDDVQVKLDNVNAVVQENVTGARVVKAYVREQHEIERFSKANDALYDRMIRVQFTLAFLSPLMMIVMNLTVIAVIILGGFEVQNMALKVGDVTAIILYITQILNSVMMISNMFQFISRAQASAKRINEVMDAYPVIRDGAYEGEGEEAKRGHVVFKNVMFRYPGTTGSPILKNIDLDIKAGENIAILGATGSGKTSLVQMIPRYYDPTDGEILLDGVPVKDYKVKTLRTKIAYVLQKSELFSGTVAENLRWGDPNATDEELKEAARIAQAEEFIGNFAAGYDTMISEKGASLSGGQKQRLAIARALLKKPDVLIFDDSMSALDVATSARLQKALREKLSDMTVITIAQRVASVMNADRILVLDGATVAAIGTHDELFATSAIYRDIYESQLKRGESIE
ncbi:MAG: ABC transporter ATP-binding protein [Clostridia bacterium]|nr:ABC transporter ATP-binding protein [Clostridia bacterium]